MYTRHYFYSSLTDEELLILMTKDKSAEKEFYRRYRYRIFRWIAHVSFWDKEDLFQECLIALYNAVETYRSEKHTRFNTYAKVCVHNHMYSYLRKYTRPVDYLDMDMMEEIAGKGSFPSEVVDEKLLLEGFMGTLSPLERRIVVKRFVEQKSYVDIASEVAISPKKVDNILYKIRHALEKYLDK